MPHPRQKVGSPPSRFRRPRSQPSAATSASRGGSLPDRATTASTAPGDAVGRGVAWLVEAVESGRFRDPSPIGFYFAKLWYFEKLYPLIFTVAALGRVCRTAGKPAAM